LSRSPRCGCKIAEECNITKSYCIAWLSGQSLRKEASSWITPENEKQGGILREVDRVHIICLMSTRFAARMYVNRPKTTQSLHHTQSQSYFKLSPPAPVVLNLPVCTLLMPVVLILQNSIVIFTDDGIICGDLWHRPYPGRIVPLVQLVVD
jgi:hypothetical protein